MLRDRFRDVPKMSIELHPSKRITDLDGKEKVVVTGGNTPGVGRLNSTLIYDIDAATWATGKRGRPDTRMGCTF